MIELLPQRLIEKIMPEPNTGCWHWMGATDDKGYGLVRHGGRHGGRTVPAHRLVYELLRGAIPSGLTLDHLCRVRCCVNPDHLEPVTLRENILRGTAPQAHNARKTHCPNGHPYDTRDNSGRRRRCTACQVEYGREWYLANKEQRRAYREKHRERLRERNHEWYLANKEQQRAYREANRERIRGNNRRYRARKAQQPTGVT